MPHLSSKDTGLRGSQHHTLGAEGQAVQSIVSGWVVGTEPTAVRGGGGTQAMVQLKGCGMQRASKMLWALSLSRPVW